ncbi:MAG: molybdopterin-binding protein [Bacillota bacterium]
MKTVSVYDSVGMVLCHDLTQIIPGKFKGCAFKKGHIIRQEDIPQLLDMGKEHLYVWDLKQGFVHENDAALRIARAAAGKGISISEPKEGKVELCASSPGLLKINTDALFRVNEQDKVMFATIHSNQTVPAGKVVGGTRVIPLVVDSETLEGAEKLCRDNYPLIEVKPFRSIKVGVVTTGSEVYKGRIEDKFGPVIFQKIEELGSTILRQIFVPDSVSMISESILKLIEEGAEMIAVTGGMSVDPDDLTPAGIKKAGGNIVTYGAPVLPGAMFMLAYIGQIPVLGLPGCVMYHKTSIFDLVVPRILAGETLTIKDISRFAHGGLCIRCTECRYPDCAFGKGI